MVLVENVLFVHVLKYFGPDDCVQVGLHEVEYQVQILVIFCFDEFLEPNDMGMPIEFPQEDDFTEGSLRVGGILKSIEDLLNSNDIPILLIDGLPDDPVGALA